MRFDSGFKRTSVQDPRGLLHMAGRLRLDEPAEVVPFEREIVAPQKIADSLFRVRDADGRVRVEQLEALARWHGREQDAILQRAATVLLLRELDEADYHLTIVLLSPVGAPETLPVALVRGRTCGEVVIRPRYVRMWELEGAEYLALGRLWLLPWVPLMRAGPELVQAAAARINAAGDEGLASQFVTLGSLCYSKDDLRRMIGRIAPMFTTELAMQTPVGQEILHAGIEQGIEQGRRQEAVRALRLFLRSRYPGLEQLPEVDNLVSAADPEAVLEAVYRAEDEAGARAILRELR